MMRTRSGSRGTGGTPTKTGINLVPDEILVKIFHYTPLTTKIGTISRVCKRWRMVCNDDQLWRIIDINSANVTTRNITKIIQTYAGQRTKVLRIAKSMPAGGLTRKNAVCLTENVMKVLMKKCDNLEELYLQCLDLRSFSRYYKIPSTLRRLYIIDCYYYLRSSEAAPTSSTFVEIKNHQCLELVDTRHSPHVFQSSNSFVTLKQIRTNSELRYLGLGNNHCLMGGDLCKILPMKQLTHLDIHRPSRSAMFFNSIEKLIENLPNLQQLDISECQLSIDGNRDDFGPMWMDLWSGTVPNLTVLKLCLLKFVNLPSDTSKDWFELPDPFNGRKKLKVVGCRVGNSEEHVCELQSIIPSSTTYLPLYKHL